MSMHGAFCCDRNCGFAVRPGICASNGIGYFKLSTEPIALNLDPSGFRVWDLGVKPQSLDPLNPEKS